ncbi:MAG: phosphorylase [Acidobacteriota bacterium]|nr:phosphorylase [Acidobacteriota bacterium]
MSECVAVIAALPREVALLVRGWRVQRRAGGVDVYTREGAVVACAGMGEARAATAVGAAMAAAPVTRLISVGLAGACDPALPVGSVVRPGLVVDTHSGERFRCSEALEVLVSTHAIANVAEKQRLYASYSASAVDMEAASVARMARAHDLPFQAIKAISDDAGFELQELGRFATRDGQFREVAFAAYAATRPKLWGKLLPLARNSKRALRALTLELEKELG